MDGVLLSPEIAASEPAQRLGAFDAAPALRVETDVFRRNVEALRIVAPALADAVIGEPLPHGWRAVSALDGFPTYQIDDSASGESLWRCGTAAPRTRAEAVLAAYSWKSANPALPALGTGAELAVLLGRLPVHAAVYVFVEEWAELAAGLRLLDFAEALERRRCVLIPPANVAQYLRELLESHPGLLAPGQIVRMVGVSDPRLECVRGVCEAAVREVNERRAARLAMLNAAAEVDPRAPGELRRLALLDPAAALDAESRSGLLTSAESLGLASLACVCDGPTTVHPLVQFERLAEFKPDLTLLVNPNGGAIPRPLAGPVMAWFLDADAVPVAIPADRPAGCASPAVRAALLAAGAAAERVVECYWAVSDAAANAAKRAYVEAAERSEIVLIGPGCEARPESWGIDQPMHRQLWAQTRRAIFENWTSAAATDPRRMLDAAEKRLGAALRDAELRAAFLRGVERALIPAAVAERISRTVDEAGHALRVCHKGELRWESCDGQPRANGMGGSLATGGVPPCALILPWLRDPLGPALLRAAASRIPILMHAPDTRTAGLALGGVLAPGVHLTTFSAAAELRAVLGRLRSGDAELAKRAQRAREHVLAHHTWAQRARALQAVLAPNGVFSAEGGSAPQSAR